MTIFAKIIRTAQTIPKIQLKTAETRIKCQKAKVKYFCNYLMQLGVEKLLFSGFQREKPFPKFPNFNFWDFRIRIFQISEFGQFPFP